MSTASPPPAARPSRVLVADDDEEVRALLGAVLRADGYDVIEARNGAMLTDFIESAPSRGGDGAPDLVVTDVMMPGLNGLDVLALLRSDDSATPVVLVTCLSDEETRARALAYSADAYFVKPPDLDELRATVRRLLARRATPATSAPAALPHKSLDEHVAQAARRADASRAPEAHAPDGGAAAPHAAPPPDPYVGAIIAERYRVLECIGAGGMGRVYVAEQLAIEKRVALKVLSDDYARSPELVARFVREAKAASRIGHENIIDVTDIGQTPSGSVFFAMELLRGESLAARLRRPPALSTTSIRRVAVQVCRALGAAHAKGVVHRDVKPENVFLVERADNPEFVKVLDFGIARVSTTHTRDAEARLTLAGTVFGTPEYMPPEQARGMPADQRADIYSVGCMLYEMLTGALPFEAPTAVAILTRQVFDAPRPIPPASGVPPELEAVVMRALRKRAAERFQSMAEMIVALAGAAGH